MNSFAENGRSLPIYAMVPALLVAFLLLIYALKTCEGRALRFIVFAIWLRIVLSSLHVITFTASPLKLSYNALGSIFVIGLGLWTLRPRNALDLGLLPFYPLFGVVVLSGALNHSGPAMIDAIVKYGYLAIIILAVVDALDTSEWDRALAKIFLPFWILIGFQALSIPLGVLKASESDGSASYIAGFAHESGFSIILIGGLLALAMRQRMHPAIKVLFSCIFVTGILLANYRTAIIGMAPIIGAMALFGAARSVVRSQRTLVLGMAAILVGVVAIGAFTFDEERFADVGTVLQRGTSIIQPPTQFDEEDRHLMSGRALIWSRYIYAYAAASPVQHVVGLGPNSWVGTFTAYAHNTLVSALYEFGMLGVAATLFLWLWMFGLAIRARTPVRPILIAAHLGFFLLSMATMPLWQIEGMILYGILCGCSVQAYRLSRRANPNRPITRAASWRPYTA